MPRKKIDLFDRWATIILRLAVYCITILIVSQAALYLETPRRFLSQVDRLEGEPVSWQTPLVAEVPHAASPATPALYSLERLRPSREIVLRLVSPASDRDIYVLVNGSRQGDFAGGEIKLTVYDGDYLEVDASRRTRPVRLIIHLPGGGVDSPVDGTLLEGAGGLIPVGKVKLKH